MHAKLERLLSKSLTTLEVMAYYLVVHTGPELHRDQTAVLGVPTSDRQSGVVVGWLLNAPATCWCISGTDLLRQFYVLPH